MRNNYARISLSNLKHNIDVIRSGLSPETKYCAVVKANAYGHGMEAVARAALSHGAGCLAVAFSEEGVRLRNAGFTAPILLLGATDESHMSTVLDYRLTPAIFTVDALRALQKQSAAMRRTCGFHFKIDTGMNRIGFKSSTAFSEALDVLQKECPNLAFEGLFTHFAVSEIPDPTFTLLQGERFERFIALAHARGYRPLLHAGNSGGALLYPQFQYGMVRGGIAMYGYHPGGAAAAHAPLRPVLSWITSVVHVKTVPAGEGISYGLRYTAERDIRVATLPVGYGDGYKRCLSGRADVLIHGKRVPQIGTVCMDQMMCDVTGLPDVQTGDEAVLLGSQGDECITADEMADLAGTISYEILLSISDRVPRIFTEH